VVAHVSPDSTDEIAAAAGVRSLADVPRGAPSWFRAFTGVGRELAGCATAAAGGPSRLVVLSVPTGQYAAWALAAGALGAPCKITPPTVPGVYRCATWVEELRQVADAEVVVTTAPDRVEYRVGTTRYLKGWPVVVLPADTPDSRLRHGSLTRADREAIQTSIAPIVPRNVPWYRWWATQCLSPVVVVGDGADHLLRQKRELLNNEPTWIWPTSRTLLEVDVASVRHADRVLHHPFAVLAPDAGRREPWLRVLRPRLVVYTSWSVFERRHPATFSGTPTVVLVNRRVASSLRCAAETRDGHLADGAGLESVADLPRGIAARVLEHPVVSDDGSMDDEDGGDEDA
jgi:hypothetical protein